MQGEEHLSVRNATRAATAWAASPVGRLARIQVLVILSCSLLAVLVLLGSGRRASGSAAFRVAVWSALMLSYPAVSYTIGLMQSASFRNELIVCWGCFLLLLLGCADGIAAYSLNDSEQQARTVLNQGLQLVYVLLLVLSYVDALPLQLKVLLFLLWALSAAKLGMRVKSSVLAGRDSVLTVDNKIIADYMSCEHESCWSGYDAATMEGYKYVVAGEADAAKNGHGVHRRIDPRNPDLVTVDMVWQCEGRLLSSDEPAAGRRKDLCLSFAMFKLLRRRLGGYPLHESCLNKTRDLVKVGLLSAGDGDGDGYKRMYRVIEVELGFLFDLYYARYRSPKETLIPDTVVFVAVVAASLCTLFSPAVLDRGAPGNVVTNGFDVWLTRAVIALFVILESIQYLTLVFSDWHKVKMLCRYVRKPAAWQKRPALERALGLMCRVRLVRYWKNSVGQYSVLRACLHSQRPGIWRLPLPKWVVGYLMRSRTTGHRRLPEEVKRAIYRFLRDGGLTRIRSGEYSLEKNGVLDSLYPVMARRSTAVQRILVWHIATTICDSRWREFTGARVDGRVRDNHLVATTLSAYCAYLISSAPELLPEHSYDTQLLLEGVQHKARERLAGCQSWLDMCSRLPDLQPSPGDDVHENILAEGKKLGLDTEAKLSPEQRWKMLAELWAEMLLSVAPSDKVIAHVKRLATGGELITHLWALLTHAGIIEERAATKDDSVQV